MSESPGPSDGMWAVVELMGHRQRAGLISDATIGGATMLRIEHPTAVDHTGEGPVEEYYSPSAIYAIRPVSRELATQHASQWRPVVTWPPPQQALPAPLDDLVDHGYYDDELVDADIVDDEDFTS